MGIFRLVLSGDDLSRIRLLAHPDPVGEIAHAAHRLKLFAGDPVLGAWSRETSRNLGTSARRVMSVLNSDFFQYGDFGRTQPGRTTEDMMELVRATPATAWTDEVECLADVGLGSTLARCLADRHADAVEHLAKALALFHRAAIAPYWPGIQLAGAAESDRLTRLLVQGGIDQLFASLHPMITWDSPVLSIEVGRTHPPGCVHLRVSGTAPPFTYPLHGRGLVLMPSAFAPDPTVTLIDSGDEPAVVTFPLMTDWCQASGDVPTDRSPLADLLGATRAVVIAALADRGDTTTGLARRLEISAASASEHASVLRAANLVTSTRDGNRVVHHLTTLGRALAGSGTRIDRSGALHRH